MDAGLLTCLLFGEQTDDNFVDVFKPVILIYYQRSGMSLFRAARMLL